MNSRKFIASGSMAATAFTIVPSHVIGGSGFKAPSDAIKKIHTFITIAIDKEHFFSRVYTVLM